MKRARYVLAGTGSRGVGLFGQEFVSGDFGGYSELVGLFDISIGRMEAANRQLGLQLPVYTDFGAMLKELAPDGVIIATNDASHAAYIVQTLAAGKRVICEKPLAVSLDQIRSILQAARRAAPEGAISLVAHNLRYDRAITQMKKIVDDGAIGRVLNISFCENIDRRHGADYFRRWHRFRTNSGGLLIQKACHHFDVLNWLVGARPRRVIGRGGLSFYGWCGPFRGERCRGCVYAGQCDFYADLWSGNDYRLYSEGEQDSGYIRDGCVYDERIDIEDHADVLYDYENGVEVNYRFNAYASYENMQMEIEGTGGRLIYEHVYPSDWAPGKVVVSGLESLETRRLTLLSFHEGVQNFPTQEWSEHVETDRLEMLPELFGRPFDAPLTDRQATLEESAWAVLIGAAANLSIAEGSRPVEVPALLGDN